MQLPTPLIVCTPVHNNLHPNTHAIVNDRYEQSAYVTELIDTTLLFRPICPLFLIFVFFFLNDTAPPEIYPLPLPDALPISSHKKRNQIPPGPPRRPEDLCRARPPRNGIHRDHSGDGRKHDSQWEPSRAVHGRRRARGVGRPLVAVLWSGRPRCDERRTRGGPEPRRDRGPSPGTNHHRTGLAPWSRSPRRSRRRSETGVA